MPGGGAAAGRQEGAASVGEAGEVVEGAVGALGGRPRGEPRWARWLRRGGWLALAGLCAVTLRDAVCSEAVPECQEEARRGGAGVERACREQYFATGDPHDGLALARALRARGELRGATAVSQGLLLTPARPGALHVLAQVAHADGRLDEAQRALELAVELHVRGEQREEAAQRLLELSGLLAQRGMDEPARAALAQAEELAQALGDAALGLRCRAARERLGGGERAATGELGAMRGLPALPLQLGKQRQRRGGRRERRGEGRGG